MLEKEGGGIPPGIDKLRQLREFMPGKNPILEESRSLSYECGSTNNRF